jgi:energy-coupling factor transport system ATP-binding protein
VLADAAIAPPVVHLARLAGWDPVPLSVRDARRLAAPLRDALADRPRPPHRRGIDPHAVLRARGIVVRYDAVVAVREVTLDLHGGSVTALMGRNGSGKSSLLWTLQGSGPRARGDVETGGVDPRHVAAKHARARVGLVPQTPADLLYLATVAEECAQADIDAEVRAGTCRELFERIAGPVDDATHPRDLSEGQRLALVLAIQLAAAPPVMLLDEPTRGLDPTAKDRFAAIVDELADDGTAVVVATHDVELVAAVADRVIVMADGEIVADGATEDVVCASPAFAPQVSKILQPAPWLTVAQVAAALETVP